MIVSTRAQGTDCQYCEEGVEHVHATQEELDESLEDAERIIDTAFHQSVDYRLSRALLAMRQERDELQLRIEHLSKDLKW